MFLSSLFKTSDYQHKHDAHSSIMPVTVILDNALSPQGDSIEYSIKEGEKFRVLYNTFKGSHPLHGFILAVHTAFSRHLELVIKPDDIWAIVVQGLAEHVNMDPEKYRSLVVDFNDKFELKVETGTKFDWEEVIPKFYEQILEHTKPGSFVGQMVESWSTTKPINTLVYQTAVMSTVQAYFSYRLQTFCGIPKVTLEGTRDDWDKLKNAILLMTQDMANLGLIEWRCSLLEICDFFRSMFASQTPNTVQVLKNIYKYNSESGGDTISGWIMRLFPYLGNRVERERGLCLTNHLKGSMFDKTEKRIYTDCFGTGINKVPFKWEIMGIDTLDMWFVAGFDVPKVTDTSVETEYAFGIAYQ